MSDLCSGICSQTPRSIRLWLVRVLHIWSDVNYMGFTMQLCLYYHKDILGKFCWMAIINSQWSLVCSVCLLSFSSRKWQINILFLGRCFVFSGRKSLLSVFHPHTVTVYIRGLKKKKKTTSVYRLTLLLSLYSFHFVVWYHDVAFNKIITISLSCWCIYISETPA